MKSINIIIGGIIASIFLIFLCISLNAEAYYKDLNLGYDHKLLDSTSTISLTDRVDDFSKANVGLPHELPRVSQVAIIEENKSDFNTGYVQSQHTYTNSPFDSISKVEENKSTNKELTFTNEEKKLIEKEEQLIGNKDENSFINPASTSPVNSLQVQQSIVKTEEKISHILKSQSITFKKNSEILSTAGKTVLDNIFIVLKDQKDFLLKVEGHTDAGGKRAINQAISQMRADKVRDYLIEKGISDKNIHSKGFGEDKLLLLSNPLNIKNRRVEIHIKRK